MPDTQIIDGRRFTITTLRLPSAVYRVTDAGIEWFAFRVHCDPASLGWQPRADRAYVLPLREALALATAHGGSACPVQLLDAPLPASAFVDVVSANEQAAELAADGVDQFVMNGGAHTSWHVAATAH